MAGYTVHTPAPGSIVVANAVPVTITSIGANEIFCLSLVDEDGDPISELFFQVMTDPHLYSGQHDFTPLIGDPKRGWLRVCRPKDGKDCANGQHDCKFIEMVFARKCEFGGKRPAGGQRPKAVKEPAAGKRWIKAKSRIKKS